jgi:hypothetical protein
MEYINLQSNITQRYSHDECLHHADLFENVTAQAAMTDAPDEHATVQVPGQ